MSNWVYDVFLWIFSILVDLFFREVHPRGSWKVPQRGPLIFVAAPHANQVSESVRTHGQALMAACPSSLSIRSFSCASSVSTATGARRS